MYVVVRDDAPWPTGVPCVQSLVFARCLDSAVVYIMSRKPVGRYIVSKRMHPLGRCRLEATASPSEENDLIGQLVHNGDVSSMDPATLL